MMQNAESFDRYILKNVNVLDGKGSRKPGRDIIINKGIIEDIVCTGDHPYEGENVIDMEGRWLMPGMIDAHVHLCAETGYNRRGIPASYWRMETFPALKVLHAAKNAYASLMAGFTTLRNCGHVAYYEPEDVALRDGISKGLLEGPRIVASAGAITMTAGHGDLAMSRTLRRLPEYGYGEKCFDGVWSCVQGVREKVRIGADFIKIMASGGMSSGGDQPEWPNFQVDELKAIVSEAHSLNKKVAAHAQGRVSLERVVEAGIDTVEHGCHLDSQMCETMAEKGMFLVPTLRVVRILTDSPDPQEREKAKSLTEAHSMAFEAALKAGVKIAFGTDTLNSLRHGENALELLELSKAGMSNMDLIKCITSSAAEALGLQDKTGSVDKVMAADLIALDSDPAEDISILTNPSNIRMIIRDGKIIKNI